jgi:hypothetical protein
VKQEDSGVLFYEEEVKLPDWRITLLSDANILVEVEAEDDDNPRAAKLRISEVARLRRYAKLNDCPLRGRPLGRDGHVDSRPDR